MKWFKHDSDASSDAKIKKLLIRYGAVGYAVYFHCLELIAGNVSNDNITFELEHDSEIIADNLRIKGTAEKSGVQVVEEIMRFMVDLELFENHDGRITCFKMIKRLDSSMTGSQAFRKLIADAKNHHELLEDSHDNKNESHDSVMTHHDLVMNKNRTEENRTEENRTEEIIPPTPLEGGDGDDPPASKPKKSQKQYITQADAGLLIDSDKRISYELGLKLKLFAQNRREIKKPMTRLALEQTIDLLMTKIDTDQQRIDCIQLSIANGWQGVFPDRIRGNPFTANAKPRAAQRDKFASLEGYREL